ncbi:MAG: heavy metal-binding domain-containing protein, partial [Vibrio ordalii]
MKSLNIAVLSLAIGGLLGFGINQYLSGHDMEAMNSAKATSEPLYWVAPMDPNYKRDKPGKSPMGMDLIPVYTESLTQAQEKSGTVTI